MHDLIGQDLWVLGNAKFSEKNYVAKRQEADRRRIKKSQVRSCIMKNIESEKDGAAVTILADIDFIPSWQEKICTIPNNLGL